MRKSAVVFYTWGGQAKTMAEEIAKLTGADIIEVKPKTPYSDNYSTCVKDAKKEMDEGKLPELTETDFDMSAYDTVYVGSPIWFGTIAAPIAAFLTEVDLTGKIVKPFVTHGGGGKGHTDKDVAALCPGSDVKPALAVYEGGKKEEIEAWVRA